MSVDTSAREYWELSQQTNRDPGREVAFGGGGHQPPGMEADLAVLKQRADHADQRMERIEQKLDRVIDKLDGVASKEDVRRAESAAWNALGTGGAIAFAVVGIFVGMLAYLQDQRIAIRPEPTPPAMPAPIILQFAPWPPPPAPTVPPTPVTPG